MNKHLYLYALALSLAAASCLPAQARVDVKTDPKLDARADATAAGSQAPAGTTAASAEQSLAIPGLAIPAPLTLRGSDLALTRQRLQAGDPLLQAPFAALKRRADAALSAPARSVTHKTTVPPSGSKNDYMSMGPYWWPNPATPSGLPYVRRDGVRNPETAGNALDAARLQAMLADVRDLALAYHYTGEERYAQKAAANIRTWYLDPATRMNPSLRFGQSIPGITEGRGIGIIDTRDMWWVIDAVALTASAAGSLNDTEQQALRQWFADYAEWLHTSQLGRDEAAEKNNHGMFYDMQLAAFWLYAGETAKARELVLNAKTLRLASQIDAQGRLPLELKRTRPYHYHTFTLEAITRLARYGQVLADMSVQAAVDSTSAASAMQAAEAIPCDARAGAQACAPDLWRWQADGKSIAAVLDFIAAPILEPAGWAYATTLEAAPPLIPALPVLLQAQGALPMKAARYSAALERLRPLAPDHVAWLLWPLQPLQPLQPPR